MTVSDEFWMQQALALALEAREHSPPLPWVGCIIERKGAFLAKGVTTTTPSHIPAEIAALESLKKKEIFPQAGTLYTILEPSLSTCQSIIASGISTVVIGTLDPDSNVFGKSVRMLKEGGISVRFGILEREVAFELRAYLHYQIRKETYAVLKIAQSLNGGIVEDIENFLSEEALNDQASFTRSSQAVLINAQRIVLPSTKHHEKTSLLPIVIDEIGMLTPYPDILYVTSAIVASAKNLDRNNVNILVWEEPGPISISWIKKNLAKRGILQILVDGDKALIRKCIEEQAFDELIIYLIPIIMQSTTVEIPGFKKEEPLRLIEMKKLGQTAKLLYLPQRELPF